MRSLALVLVTAITLSRLAMAALSVGAMRRLDWTAAWWLFLATCLTDIVDGWLARRLRVATRFGRYLDSSTDVITCWTLVWGLFVVLHSQANSSLAHIPIVLAVNLWLFGLLSLVAYSLFGKKGYKSNYWQRHGSFWYGMVPLGLVGFWLLYQAGGNAWYSLPLAIYGLYHPMRRHLAWRVLPGTQTAVD